MTTLTINPAHLGNRALTLTIGELPDLAHEPVHRAISACLFFVPRWVRQLDLRFDREQDGSYAQIGTNLTKRQAWISFGKEWLAHPDGDAGRVRTLLHELAHLWLSPLCDLWPEVIKPLAEHGGPVCGTITNNALVHGEETVVHDLACAFAEMIESGALAPVSIDLLTGARTTPPTSPKRPRGRGSR